EDEDLREGNLPQDRNNHLCRPVRHAEGRDDDRADRRRHGRLRGRDRHRRHRRGRVEVAEHLHRHSPARARPQHHRRSLERLVIGEAVELMIESRPTAVIAEATTWAEFPQLWPALLGEVWTTVRTMPDAKPGRNVMLYLDDVPHVEVGVEVDGAFGGAGRI